jgi:hypothetical protein
MSIAVVIDECRGQSFEFVLSAQQTTILEWWIATVGVFARA